jgi:hypothetical protein
MGFVIAVDGPAASGKGTIANRLGALYGYPVLDSGLLYRGVGVKLSEQGGDLDDVTAATAAAEALEASPNWSVLSCAPAPPASWPVASRPSRPSALACATSSYVSRPGSRAR